MCCIWWHGLLWMMMMVIVVERRRWRLTDRRLHVRRRVVIVVVSRHRRFHQTIGGEHHSKVDSRLAWWVYVVCVRCVSDLMIRWRWLVVKSVSATSWWYDIRSFGSVRNRTTSDFQTATDCSHPAREKLEYVKLRVRASEWKTSSNIEETDLFTRLLR